MLHFQPTCGRAPRSSVSQSGAEHSPRGGSVSPGGDGVHWGILGGVWPLGFCLFSPPVRLGYSKNIPEKSVNAAVVLF